MSDGKKKSRRTRGKKKPADAAAEKPASRPPTPPVERQQTKDERIAELERENEDARRAEKAALAKVHELSARGDADSSLDDHIEKITKAHQATVASLTEELEAARSEGAAPLRAELRRLRDALDHAETAKAKALAEASEGLEAFKRSAEVRETELRDAAHADIMRERETANATPDAAQIKAVIVEEMKGKLKAKEAKLLLQFEAKSKQASDLIKKAETGAEEARHHLQRADEREQEAVARAETLRAAADAAQAEAKALEARVRTLEGGSATLQAAVEERDRAQNEVTTLEKRVKALEGGGSEALKAAVDAKEAEVREHLIGKLKEKVQKAKLDAQKDAEASAVLREQKARAEGLEPVKVLEGQLADATRAAEAFKASSEKEKAEATTVFEGLLAEKDDRLKALKRDFEKACAEESAAKASKAAEEASQRTREELLGKLKDKVAKATAEALQEGKREAEALVAAAAASEREQAERVHTLVLEAHVARATDDARADASQRITDLEARVALASKAQEEAVAHAVTDASTKIKELETTLAKSKQARDQAVLDALAEANDLSAKAVSDAERRVAAVEDTLASAGDLFATEKREALEDAAKASAESLAEVERKVGAARADAEAAQRTLKEATEKHAEALGAAADQAEAAVTKALEKASQAHEEAQTEAVRAAVAAAAEAAVSARANLTSTLETAQRQALDGQAERLQSEHEAQTRKLEARHDEALDKAKRDADALSSKVDRSDAAQQTLEARGNDLEAKLKQATDAHARELRSTREDLELRHRADKEAAVLQAKWGAAPAPVPQPRAAPVQDRRAKELAAAHAIELRRAQSEAEHLRQQVRALEQSNAYMQTRPGGGCATDVVPQASFMARGCMASVSNNLDRLMNVELPFNRAS